MNANYHRLDAEADSDFLARGVTDPFTGTAFRPTNVVVLTADGTVMLRESWEALGGTYAGSSETLDWAAGDGAMTSAPPVAATGAGFKAGPRALPATPAMHASAPEPMPEHVRLRKRPAWVMPLLAVLGVALLVVIGLLVASLLGNRDDAPPPVVEEQTDAAPEVVALAAGVFEGTLGDGDAEANGRYEDRFSFAADSSGRVLSFVLASEDFRPDLVVVGPDGQRYEAEASGDDGNRVVVNNLRGPGRFQVLVTSRETAGEGEYTLRIRQETPIRTLAADGKTVRATLGERSQLDDGIFKDTYEFRVEAEREYTLTVASSAFDIVSTVTDTRGSRVQIGRGGTFTPTENARYRLVVSSRETGQRGAYTVQLKAGPKPERPDANETETAAPAVRALRANSAPISDSLAVGDQRTFTFTGAVGDRVRVDARALGFDPSIVLVGPDGRRISRQGAGERANVSETLATDGTYRVIVSGNGGSGQFQVSLEKTEAPRAADIPRMPGIDEPPPPPAQDDGEDGDGESPPDDLRR